jgi:hypothetical protein
LVAEGRPSGLAAAAAAAAAAAVPAPPTTACGPAAACADPCCVGAAADAEPQVGPDGPQDGTAEDQEDEWGFDAEDACACEWDVRDE